MGLKYTVVCDTLLPLGYDVLKEPELVLGSIRASGCEGADIPGKPGKVNVKRIKELATSFELEIPEVLGAWAVWHSGINRDLGGPDESVRRRAIQYSKDCIDLAYGLDSHLFELCASPPKVQYPKSETPFKTLTRNFVRAAKEICKYASDRSVTVLLEPLNKYEGYPGFLNTIEHALVLIDEIGEDNLGIQADLFHMNLEEVSICDALRRAGNQLRHVHLADSNREAPGTGHTDFTAVVRTLREIDFKGFIAFDCVAPKPDMKTFLDYSVEYMKEMEKSYNLQRGIHSRHRRRGS